MAAAVQRSYCRRRERGEETKYNALEVGADNGMVRFDPGPYTNVEDFLQLVRRLD
jgi:hypothetical protein